MSGDLDKMLAEWPMPPPNDLERDDAAERVTSAIASSGARAGAAGPELDALLAAPLPARDSEKNLAAGAHPSSGRASIPSSAGVENKMSKDRGRDRTSFQELAKLAGTPAPQPVTPSLTPAPGTGVVRAEEGGSDDSGIVDLKMVAALDPAAQERAKATPLAAQGLFDDDAPASAAAAVASAPPPSVSAVAQSSAPVAAAAATPSAAPPASAVASLAPPKKEEKKKGGGGLVLLFGGLLAAGAIAAGAFFVVKSGVLTGGKGSVAVTTPAKPAETGAAATATATGAATVAAVDTGAAGVDMNTLPGTSPTTTGGRTMPKINAVGNGTKPTTVASADTPAATGTVDPKLVANNIPNSNTGGGGDLTAAMKAAAGGGSANPTGTDTATGPQYAAGTVPQKPSQGQVQGAINAVLPEARKCLAEGDPISRATIVFQSDGSVKSVAVSGFAAGKPAEACVQTALKKAKISPFAEATYTFPVTVRAQ